MIVEAIVHQRPVAFSISMLFTIVFNPPTNYFILALRRMRLPWCKFEYMSL